MNVSINDKAVDVPQGLSVSELLVHQKVKMPDMVSVQVNGTIVDRDRFSSTPVRENDIVEFLYFMGGGGER